MLKELKHTPATVRGRRRQHRRRSAVIATIALLLVLLLALAAALWYVWWTGQHAEVKVSKVQPAPTREVAPPKVADNAPVGVSISVLTSPLSAGSNASITIRTKPKAACSIIVTYDNSEKSRDSGLVPKMADEYGVVSWSWSVESNRTKGKWPIDITCAENGKSGYMRGELVVQ